MLVYQRVGDISLVIGDISIVINCFTNQFVSMAIYLPYTIVTLEF